MPSRLERAVSRHRRLLLAEDAGARRDLDRAYRSAGAALRRQVAEKDAAVAALDPTGGLPTFDARGRFTEVGEERWTAARSRRLLAQVDAELQRIEAQAANGIAKRQRTAIGLAVRREADMMAATAPRLAGSFATLPVSAFEGVVGQLSDGSPLRSLLAVQGADALDAASRALTDAVALGRGPREVGRDLARILARSQWRAEQTARNAILDAHRNASLGTYAANAHVLDHWIWTAAKSERTCLACLALDGRRFPLSVRFMAHHSACRCAPRPGLRAEFGPTPEVEDGATWFSRQPAATRRGMVPAALWEEFVADAVGLDDFVVRENHPRWGPSLREATVREARQNAAMRGRMAA